MEYWRNASSIFENDMGTSGHVLLVPYPIQGHIKSFMKLSHLLAEHRITVTFAIPEFTHTRLLSEFRNLEGVAGNQCNRVRLMSVPDGLEPGDDCKDERKIAESINRIMPGFVEELIKKTNYQSNYEVKITCVIADVPFCWALELADKMGIKCAMFFTSAPGILGITIGIPKLMESGIIDTDGSPMRDEKIEISPNLPALTPAEFSWNFPGDLSVQKMMFATFFAISQNVKVSDWVLCNWFHELDPAITELVPNMLSIGPLLTHAQRPSGTLWSEDLTCLSWLDQHPPNSVIYIAFGSTWFTSQHQLHELALGLELSSRPFLWVIRSDFCFTCPEDFLKRTSGIGKIVRWTRQDAVLAHQSIACYVTHCGWNSTVEAIAAGVPMLCWPSYADQFYNKTCVCEGWGIGLWLRPDEDGFVHKYEIRKKVDELMGDEKVRVNVEKWKKMAKKSGSEGGSSSENLKHFLDQIRG